MAIWLNRWLADQVHNPHLPIDKLRHPALDGPILGGHLTKFNENFIVFDIYSHYHLV